jgi:hypothetical protein
MSVSQHRNRLDKQTGVIPEDRAAPASEEGKRRGRRRGKQDELEDEIGRCSMPSLPTHFNSHTHTHSHLSSRSEASSRTTGRSQSSSTVCRAARQAWYEVPQAMNIMRRDLQTRRGG